MVSLINIIRSGLIITLFLMLGKFINYVSALPIPSAILGLILLFLALNLRLVKVKHLTPTSSLLLNNMTLFFVPVGVGLLQHLPLLHSFWLAIVVSSMVSTLLVLLTVGWLYQRLVK